MRYLLYHTKHIIQSIFISSLILLDVIIRSRNCEIYFKWSQEDTTVQDNDVMLPSREGDTAYKNHMALNGTVNIVNLRRILLPEPAGKVDRISSKVDNIYCSTQSHAIFILLYRKNTHHNNIRTATDWMLNLTKIVHLTIVLWDRIQNYIDNFM